MNPEEIAKQSVETIEESLKELTAILEADTLSAEDRKRIKEEFAAMVGPILYELGIDINTGM